LAVAKRLAGGLAGAASEAWYTLLRYMERHTELMTDALKREGLSPVMAGFLDEIAKHPPAPMSRLVNHLGVDAAWVTDVVDKLEARGDVVRRSSPEDRRVKIIEVTEAGRRTHRVIEGIMRTPPRALLQCSDADVRALARIAQRLDSAESVERGGPDSSVEPRGRSPQRRQVAPAPR
jgi:MarR family transcriptional regulator, organic hydroperoxide resistance regulator